MIVGFLYGVQNPPRHIHVTSKEASHLMLSESEIEDRAAAIIKIAEGKAEHRSIGSTLKSKLGTKFHKWKKPGNIITTAAAVPLNFIPIPFISDGIGWAIDKGTAAVRDRSHQKKLAKYEAAVESIDPSTAAAAKNKLLKFQVKDIDIKHLEESMRKAKNQLVKYNGTSAGTEQDCKKAAEVAYRYARARYRLDVLIEEALGLQTVATAVLTAAQQGLSSLEEQYPNMVAAIQSITTHEVKCKAGSACCCETQASQGLLAFSNLGGESDD